jgi:hypothetical protein
MVLRISEFTKKIKGELKLDTKKVKQALALFHSMVSGGEQHSETSQDVFNEAMAELTKANPLEPQVSDDLVREVEEKFNKMMMGVNYTDNLIYIVNPHLRSAYELGRACKLDEVTLLKNCCVILQEELDKRTNEAIKQASNGTNYYG